MGQGTKGLTVLATKRGLSPLCVFLRKWYIPNAGPNDFLGGGGVGAGVGDFEKEYPASIHVPTPSPFKRQSIHPLQHLSF